ncbi:MAG TPA: zinc ribbon domain-containing protein [Bacillota bacterium]
MSEESIKICQSCAMPLNDPNLWGSNADGSKNEDYCLYCYNDGRFTTEESMEEMIESCVPHTSHNNPWPDDATAHKAMHEIFPKLKRWQNRV